MSLRSSGDSPEGEISDLPPESALRAAERDELGGGDAAAVKKAEKLVDQSATILRYRQFAVASILVVLALLGYELFASLAAHRQMANTAIQSLIAPPSAASARVATAASNLSPAASSPKASASSSSEVAVHPSLTAAGPKGAAVEGVVNSWFASMVAVTTILVIAMTVLAIALLRATFAAADSAKAIAKEPGLLDGVPGIEMVKALRDTLDTLLKKAG